jgi:hypothetical protein
LVWLAEARVSNPIDGILLPGVDVRVPVTEILCQLDVRVIAGLAIKFPPEGAAEKSSTLRYTVAVPDATRAYTENVTPVLNSA